MTPQAEGRLHGLDTLRAAAILWVMPYHLNSHFPEALQGACRFGWMGVDLFFVLSGYLITSQMLRAYEREGHIRPWAFYTRRAYRILPAYLFILLLYVLWPAWRESPGLQAPWQFWTFTENFLIDYEHNQAFSHAWSLCVEEHFYLVLPLVATLLLRRPAAWKTCGALGIVLLAGFCLRAYVLVHWLQAVGPDDDRFGVLFIEKMYYPTYTRLDGLLAGVALALALRYRSRWCDALLQHGHGLFCLGTALLLFSGWCSFPRFRSVTGRAVVSDLVGPPVLALGFALLVASALSQNGVLARWRVPGARPLATLAFALYLTHKEAVHLLYYLWPGGPDNTYLALPVLLIACLGVASMLYLGVERPFLKLRAQMGFRLGSLERVDRDVRNQPAL